MTTPTASTVPKSGIQEAISLAKTQTALAQRLGCSQQFISRCEKRGWVPQEMAKLIEFEYGVPRLRLVHPKLRDLVEDGV